MKFECTEQETAAFFAMVKVLRDADRAEDHDQKVLEAITTGGEMVKGIVGQLVNCTPEQRKTVFDIAEKFVDFVERKRANKDKKIEKPIKNTKPTADVSCEQAPTEKK